MSGAIGLTNNGAWVIRRADVGDDPRLVELIVAHCRLERAGRRATEIMPSRTGSIHSIDRSTGCALFGRENVMAGIRTMWSFDNDVTVELGPILESGSTITRTWTYTFADQTTHKGVDIFTFEDGQVIKKDAYCRSNTGKR